MRNPLFNSKNHKFNYTILILIIILIFAFFLRIYALSSQPLWIDESISGVASKMILEKGVPIFDSTSVYARAIVYHYAEAFFLLFGQNDFNARFFSVIIGMFTIVLAYFIGKEYSKTGGILCALFMSVFYLEVFFSRQARFYQLFQLMFFLTLYLLYKSGESAKNKNKKHELIYLILSIVAFFIALDTQIAALVLAPFIILHIIVYNTKYNKLLAILPAIPLIQKFMPAASLANGGTNSTKANYAEGYFGYAGNMHYLLIFAIPGLIWAFFKKKKLTLLLTIPSIVLLVGVILLQVFALRYIYFIAFPLVIYSSLLFSYLYEKFGKFILIAIIAILIIPSNIVYPYTYVNVINPIDHNHSYGDFTTPETNYKNLPQNITEELKSNNTTIISFFSSDVEWNIKKPSYVIPFTMDGIGYDEVSYNKTTQTSDNIKKVEVVDIYSGAPILNYNSPPKKPFYITQDSFSYSKLKPTQLDSYNNLTKDCTEIYKANDLKILECK
jgi:hypothetical protein